MLGIFSYRGYYTTGRAMGAGVGKCMGKSFKLWGGPGRVGGPTLAGCSVGNRYKVAGAGYQRLRSECVGKVLKASSLASHAGRWEKTLTRDVTPGFGSASYPLCSPGKVLCECGETAFGSSGGTPPILLPPTTSGSGRMCTRSPAGP